MREINIKLQGKKVLITGAAGFIGANLILELLHTVKKIEIVGIDNMNDYYDVSISIYSKSTDSRCACVALCGASWSMPCA